MQGDTMPQRPAGSQQRLAALMPFSATVAALQTERHSLQAQELPPRPERALRPHSPVRIVFVLMSAVAQAATVDQLAQALAPHVVLVHHDFSQTPHFPLSAPKVRFVPAPVRTGWAQFGFVQGIFHSLSHALQDLDFDYLQLLSPTCLPIKPLALFEQHVSGPADAHFDCVDLLSDPDALLSVGYRAFTACGNWRHRVARRLVNMHYGSASGQREEAGIWLRSGAPPSLGSHLAGWALAALAHPALGRHLRQQPLRLYYGSPWFGARRHIVAQLVRSWQQPGVQEHFRKVHMAEEFLLPSLLMHTRPLKGRLNHVIQHFDQAHPGRFDLEDLDFLQQSPAFFARKFADDPLAPVRLRVLSELLQHPPQRGLEPPSQAVHTLA